MAVKLIAENCTGCRLCLRACPYGAIDIVEDRASFNDNCTQCGACASACKFGAILLEVTFTRDVDTTQYRGLWVMAEHLHGEFRRGTYELLGEGPRAGRQARHGTLRGAARRPGGGAGGGPHRARRRQGLPGAGPGAGPLPHRPLHRRARGDDQPVQARDRVSLGNPAGPRPRAARGGPDRRPASPRTAPASTSTRRRGCWCRLAPPSAAT